MCYKGTVNVTLPFLKFVITVNRTVGIVSSDYPCINDNARIETEPNLTL